MTRIALISPVDGSVCAERAALPLVAAQDAVARARRAGRVVCAAAGEAHRNGDGSD